MNTKQRIISKNKSCDIFMRIAILSAETLYANNTDIQYQHNNNDNTNEFNEFNKF